MPIELAVDMPLARMPDEKPVSAGAALRAMPRLAWIDEGGVAIPHV